MSSEDLNDDDVFLSPSADVPVGELMGGTHVVNGSRPSSGYYSRQTSGYTASQDTPPTSAVLRVEDEATDRQRTPSPTGYRGAMPPPAQVPTPEEDDIIHKTILLGDSGVGKTSLLVQFDTGKFQPGTFSATVGIGFTIYYEKKEEKVCALDITLRGLGCCQACEKSMRFERRPTGGRDHSPPGLNI
nr:uncharacterized protein LOC113816275 [Penaeus vannamei]